MRSRLVIVLGVAIVALVGGMVVGDGSGAVGALEDRSWPEESLEARLGALDGTDAMAYFVLGEDVAALGADEGSVRLARELFVIAWEVDREGGGGLGLGRSVALALAELAGPEDRGWLRALAASEGGVAGGVRASWASAVLMGEDAVGGDDSARRLAEGLTRLRAGEGVRARAAVRPVSMEEVLRGAGLGGEDTAWVMERFEALFAEPRCPVCNNARVVQSGRGPEARYVLCSRGGHPGPDVGGVGMLRLIRAEALLLGVEGRTWGGQFLVDRGAPVRTLDASSLAEVFGVDAGARVYEFEAGAVTRGRWRRP